MGYRLGFEDRNVQEASDDNVWVPVTRKKRQRASWRTGCEGENEGAVGAGGVG